MSINWIFFDVGSTLVNEEESQRKRFLAAGHEIKKAYGRSITYEEFCSLMDEGARLREVSPFYYALRKLGVKSKYAYSREDETVYGDSKETLSRLKPKYNLGIIANQPADLAGRLKAFGLLEYFDAVFGSDDVELEKPDTEFYLYALRETGCKPQQAVMVGDRLDNDIVPAKRAGMKTIRILRGHHRTATVQTEDETPDFTAEQLSEIPVILAGI